MPGDEVLTRPAYASTRAITIGAPPDHVWPWLVQVGCGRAGFHSDDLLDNLGRPSSRTLVPALQHLEVGQVVPMSPAPTEATSFRVAAYAAPHEPLWSKPDSAWSWRLTEEAPGRTRVVSPDSGRPRLAPPDVRPAQLVAPRAGRLRGAPQDAARAQEPRRGQLARMTPMVPRVWALGLLARAARRSRLET